MKKNEAQGLRNAALKPDQRAGTYAVPINER